MRRSILASAFSLVELSIVLVILGLLVGGVLAGRSLIRASEIRSVAVDYSRFVTAAMAFRDKYFFLPGGMPNAQTVWGVADADPANCRIIAGTGTQTCNGDGNGAIEYSTGADERFRFWQHLANAGLIEGTYLGTSDPAGGVGVTAANVPKSKIPSALWHIYYEAAYTSVMTTYVFLGTYGNNFQFGGAITANVPAAYTMKPEEVWNVGTKVDDGKPATGKVVARVIAADGLGICTDTTDNTNLNANYLLSSTTLSCNPLFRRLF